MTMFFEQPLTPIATSREILSDAINKVFDRRAAADQVMSDIEDEQVISGEEGIDQIDIDIIDADDEAPIIRLVNAILNQAVKARASDIHIEPFDRILRSDFASTVSCPKSYTPKEFMPRSLAESRSWQAWTLRKSVFLKTDV